MNYTYIFLFLVGLGFGSFLNVVSIRFKPENQVFDLNKIGGRSACPYCQKTLRWYELIPIVSFFIQARKCRSCGHKISWQYPIGELLGGLIFVAVPLLSLNNHLFLFPEYYRIIFWVVWIFALLILLLISLIDFINYLIPDELTWLLIILGCVLITLQSGIPGLKLFDQSFLHHYALLLSWDWLSNIWVNHLFAGLIAGIFFGLMFYFGKGEILGGGDIKLGFALGWLLGWPDILMALFITFILGGATGLVLMLSRKKTMKDFLPLAPFLSIGVALTVLFGYQIINGYFSLFGL